MKVCFSSFTCPQWTLAQIMSGARGFGYHGVELRCDAHHQHGVEINTSPEDRHAIAEMFTMNGVEPACLSCGVQVAHPKSDELLIGRIDLAADTGFKAVRVLCGRNEYDHTKADSIEGASTRVRKAAAHALKRDIDIWVETHDVVSKAADAASLVRQVEHEKVGLLYNTLHPYRMGEKVAESFEAMGSLIRHVHFHDGLNDPTKVVVKPMGHGQLPIDDMFIALLRTGYDRYLCGEWFHDQYGHTIDESLERYLKDIHQLASRHDVRLEQAM